MTFAGGAGLECLHSSPAYAFRANKTDRILMRMSPVCFISL